MDSRKLVFKETAVVAVGECLASAIMVGIFALLGRFDKSVVLGAAFGALIAVANFFFMAMGVMLAADKAAAQDVKGGKGMAQGSYLLRFALMFLILFALGKSGICNIFALVLPLLFVRPILYIGEFFRKSGDKKV